MQSIRIKRILKILLLFFCITICLLLFFSSPPGEWSLRVICEYYIASQTDYIVFIGDLETNILNHVTIKSIKTFTKKDTLVPVLEISNLEISYGFRFTPFPTFELLSIILENPLVSIHASDWLKSSSGADSNKSTPLYLPTLPAHVIQLINGCLNLDFPEHNLKVIFSNIFLNLSAGEFADSLNGTFQTDMLPLKSVDSTQFNARVNLQCTWEKQKIRLSSFTISSNELQNSLAGDISFDSTGLNLEWTLSTNAERVEKLLSLLPVNISLPSSEGSVQLKTTIKGSLANPELFYNGKISHLRTSHINLNNFEFAGKADTEGIVLDKFNFHIFNGTIHGKSEYKWSGTERGFNINSYFSNLELQTIISNSSVPVGGKLDGYISFKGNKLNFEESIGRIELRIASLLVQNVDVGETKCTINYKQGNVSGSINLNDNEIAINGTIVPSIDLNINGAIEDSVLFQSATGLPISGSVDFNVNLISNLQKWEGAGSVLIKNFRLSDNIQLDSIKMQSAFNTDSLILLDGTIITDNNRVNLHVRGQLTPKKQIELSLSPDISENYTTEKITPETNYLYVKYLQEVPETYSVSLNSNNFDISLITQFSSKYRLLRAIVDADASIISSRSKLNFLASWDIQNIFVDSIKIEQFTGKLKGSPEILELEEMKIIRGKSISNLSFQLPADIIFTQKNDKDSSKGIIVDANINNFDLRTLSELIPNLEGLTGIVNTNLNINGNITNPFVNGNIVIQSVSLPYVVALPFVSIDSMRMVWKNSSYILNLYAKSKSDSMFLTGNGELRGTKYFSYRGDLNFYKAGSLSLVGDFSPNESDFSLITDSLEIAGLTSFIPFPLNAKGKLKLDSKLIIRSDSLSMVNQLSMSTVRLSGVIVDSLNVKATIENKRITIDQLNVYNGNGVLQGQGKVNLSSTADSINNREPERIKLSLQAIQFPLIISGSLSGIKYSKGYLNSSIDLNGSFDDIQLQGIVNLSNDTTYLTYFQEPCIISDMIVQLAQDTVKLIKLNGHLGGGDFSSDGTITLDHLRPGDYQFDVSANNLKFTVPKILVLRLKNGTLSLSNSPDGTILKGDIQLGESRYFEKIRALQFLEISRKIISPPQQKTLFDRIQTKLHVWSGNDLWIDNGMAKVQANADLGIDGPISNPRMSGRINIIEGKVAYLGREFNVQSGTVDFINSGKIDPSINLTAIYQTKILESQTDPWGESKTFEQNYDITIHLSGLLSKLNPLELSSSPSLSREDIITLITLGRRGSNLLSGSQTQGGNQFQSQMLQSIELFSSTIIAGYTEAFTQNLLRFDKVSLDGNLFQINKQGGPMLTVEKRFSPRLRMTYATSVGNFYKRKITMEYQLIRYLFLESQTDERGESGVDLKLIKRFD